ncbi:MAG: hypothetical protein ACXAEI_20715 [Candidatus Hodarchaeales archaeon]|jgi:hypothetical protein
MPCINDDPDFLSWEELSTTLAQGFDEAVDETTSDIAQDLLNTLKRHSELTPRHWSLDRAIEVMDQIRDQATACLLVLEETRAYRELSQLPSQRAERDPFEKLAKYERFLQNMTRF